MSFLKRAYLYTTRKKIRTGLLFSIILIISTLLIVCFSINSSTDIASANVRRSLKSGITINAKTLRDGLNNNDIEKISRGIYLSPSTFEDSYFSFQQKYKKAIFSHMNALYFYGMTEEFPYQYTVTVPQSYHVDTVNEKCNVFYVSDDIYEMGVVEVETPSGNKVRAYDKERCICDIIRSKGRMDSEQVKKAMKQYIQSKDKNVVKLSDYAKRMGIIEKVMEMVSVYYE